MLAAYRNIVRNFLAARTVDRSGAFDRAWYLEQNSDVRAAKLDPLQHFMEHGHIEGRNPNPIFDIAWYRDQYRSLMDADENPLVDYLRNAKSGTRKPNQFFDSQWYRATYLGGSARLDPMLHYLAVGAAKRIKPCPDFFSSEFKARHPGSEAFEGSLAGFINAYLIKGCVGTCTSYYIDGWASRGAGPPMNLTVYVNGVRQGSFTPWIERPDVRQARGFDGLGFYYVFPTRLRSGDEVVLRDEFGRSVCGAPVVYNVLPLEAAGSLYETRASIAAAFIKGRGIEIGAFSQPTDLSPDCEVTFYDRFPAEVLRAHYNEKLGRPLFEPAIVGDAEGLEHLDGETLDFIIANHVIEHMEDPIRFLKSVASRLKRDGCAMITAPDKRFNFDVKRPITPFSHVLDDHLHGPVRSRAAHFRDVHNRREGDPLNGRAPEKFSEFIHFHVWDADAFVAFVAETIETFKLPLALAYSRAANNETVTILRRLPGCRG